VKFKRLVVGCLAICLLCVTSVQAEVVQTQDQSSEQIYEEKPSKPVDTGMFDITEDGLLKEYKGDSDIVKIPTSVKKIGDYAFSQNKKIRELVIPKGVVSIGVGAFSDCKNLEQITIPSSVKSFGQRVFTNTKWLKTRKNPCVVVNGILVDGSRASGVISIPKSVKSINVCAFARNKKITEVKISSGVGSLGVYSFAYCTKLKKVSIPKSVVCLGDSTFLGCSKLKEIIGMKGINKVGGYVFTNTPWLKLQRDKSELVIINDVLVDAVETGSKAEVPKGIKLIARSAFGENSAIKIVKLPNTVKSIGSHAFFYCTRLKKISIPSSLKTIDASGFCGCTSLSEIKLPNVTEISDCAFYECSSLKNITIKNKDAIFGDLVFGCHNKGLTLHGKKNSTTQKYAKKNKLHFKAIN
jgi:hypothetical protein